MRWDALSKLSTGCPLAMAGTIHTGMPSGGSEAGLDAYIPGWSLTPTR